MNDFERNSRKAGLMLILLFAVGVFSIYVFPKVNFFPKRGVAKIGQAQTIVKPASIGDVKAATSGSGKLCMEGEVCDYIHQIEYQPVCSINDTNTDMVPGSSYSGSVSVRQNAKVEPFEITVPLVLFQGSKSVDDSKKIIDYDFPTYRDAQQIILDDELRRTCAPGDECLEADAGATIPDLAYGVHAFTEVKNAAGGGFGGDGKAVIVSQPELNSVCPKVQEANADPKRSAKYSERLIAKYQPPGEHNFSRLLDAAVDCYRNNPEGEHLEEAKNFVSCLTEVKPTDYIMNAFYTVEHWAECLADEAACNKYTITAIRLDAIFGGVFQCTNPDCQIVYFDYDKTKSIAPGDAASMIPDYIDPENVSYLQPVTEPYYLTTPCKVRIDKGGIYDVPCLWDISPYQRVYELQRSANMPSNEVVPGSFNEYWKGGVFPELKLRSRSCI